MPILQLAKIGQYNKETNPEITDTMLNEMVETAIDDIPVIPGHWAMPWEKATGWVRAKTLNAGDFEGKYSLMGSVDFGSEMAQAYENEEYKHWSIAAVADPDSEGKWKLLHLAMLGSALPAIPGLKEVPETIKASYGDDKIKYFTYSFNSKEDVENMDEIKKLQEEVGALKLELSKTKESSESDKLELQKQFDSVKESNEALELDNANLKKQVAEYENKKFDDILLQLEKSGDGKMNVEDLKSLVKEFKDEGISCKAQVERQIRIFDKMNSVVPGKEMIIENNNIDEQNKKNEAQKKARKAKM